MKTIIVLGMHRSATSLVAKGLSTQISVGPLGTSQMLDAPMPDNFKGHFENLDFVHLNDDIMESAGGWWAAPPSRARILEVLPKFSQRVQETLARNAKAPIWGWKDPRTVITLDHYLPYVEGLHLVTCFRDPYEVAKSLVERNHGLFSLDSARCLANYYNSQIIDHLSRQYTP